MRILLIITTIILYFSATLSAQSDFKTLDKKTYDFYIRGDYVNLKKTADTLLSQGIDYYYLRMRLGILSYNNQLYSGAFKNLIKAIKFNSGDSISNEYIYYSYLLSGRIADANLYLESIPHNKKNIALKSISQPGLSDIFIGSSFSGYNEVLYEKNILNYEAVKNIWSINAGLDGYLSSRFKGAFVYTNYRKEGTVYSAADSTGKDLNFSQNQVYAKLAGYIFPGWEFSLFGHAAFYQEAIAQFRPARRSSTILITEYLFGAGISKNGWKIRTGANLSLSNLGNSNQVRGEGYLTYLPSGNLNLYFTSGGMFQSDRKWGNTYQISQEIGFKVIKPLWIESGIVKGNSFLFARNQGYNLNNSFQTPAMTIYASIIILPGKHFSINVTPLYTANEIYSWNLNAYTRTNKLITNSFGGLIKLIYRNK